jgi:hypothetical protein
MCNEKSRIEEEYEDGFKREKEETSGLTRSREGSWKPAKDFIYGSSCL